MKRIGGIITYSLCKRVPACGVTLSWFPGFFFSLQDTILLTDSFSQTKTNFCLLIL